jgi:hypothetical protein
MAKFYTPLQGLPYWRNNVNSFFLELNRKAAAARLKTNLLVSAATG